MPPSILNKRKLPRPNELARMAGGRRLIVVYDRKLLQLPFFESWLKAFTYTVAVDAGENLKMLESFSQLVRTLLPMTTGVSPHQTVVVAVGGGSIGDSVGFLASVLKRGVGLVHIPSTWLAAVDSAYGGKTALNVDLYKNQVGTFYPARAVILVEALLRDQPYENLRSGFGEAQKMALIAGGALFRKIQNAKALDAKLLWQLLPQLAREKMRIVQKDPFEKTGRRMVLNLGHTFGHAIELSSKSESATTQLSHGEAVRIGLEFAARFSEKKKVMAKNELTHVLAFLNKNPVLQRPKILNEKLAEGIRSDKKASGDQRVNFIFLKKPGYPVIKVVTVAEICEFAKTIGWTN